MSDENKELLPEPVDGSVTDYEWVDTGILVVTLIDDDGYTVHETYEFSKGERVLEEDGLQ